MSWKRGLVGLAAAGLLSTVMTTTSVAASGHHTFTVWPGQSIQAAIDAAHPGDTIVVEPGTYHESLQITTDDITLVSSDPDDRSALLEPPNTPPNNLCTNFNGGPSGICVLGAVDPNGNVTRHVEGVHIRGFTIRSFPQNGVFGYGTNGLEVRDVSAFNDGGYGIARFESTRGFLRNNSVSGNAEAGLYLGDSADADAVVTNNRSWGNGIGIFVRHSHQVQIDNNSSWDNCIGILVLDEGAPGGAGDVRVSHNRVDGNNRFCPAVQGPAFSGGGIVLFGAVRTVVVDNDVNNNNSGGTIASGGIVLLSSQSPGGGSAVIDDVVSRNEVEGNAPKDISYDGSGTRNRFSHNDCDTSSPPGLCA